MARYLLLALFLGIAILVGVLSYFGRDSGTGHTDMARERGQIRPATRLGFLDMLPEGQPRKWTGVLLDAGCPLRDAAVTGLEPVRETPAPAPQAPGAAAQRTPGAAARQPSMECAVTGLTRGFAVRLSNGELRNFDEGGNTRVLEAFQGTPQGQAVLSGQAPGAQPLVEVAGQEQGDRIVVRSVRLL